MGLNRRSDQKWNSPANPDPVPLAPDNPQDALTECPACKVAIRPGAVLCISCGARLGKIETTITVAQASREPCPKCGYDLSGIKGTTCPECGGHAPFVAARISVMSEREEALSGEVLWEAYKRPLVAFVTGLVIMLALAGSWYGPPGAEFWLAVVIPTWLVASIGYFVLGAIIRFLDTTVLITLAQVAGVTMLGLAITELVFPYNSGQVYLTIRAILIVPVVIALATRGVMEDEDFWDCLLASAPITLACLIVPFIGLVLIH